MRKGTVELAILVIVANESTYSAKIIKILNKRSMDVGQGTVYPMMKRLVDDKVLTYEWREVNDARLRKYFSLSKDGEKYLKYILDNWLETRSAVDGIISDFS